MAKKEPKLPVKKTPKLIKVFMLSNEEAKELNSVVEKEHLPHDKPHYVAMVYRLQRFVNALNESTNETPDTLRTQNLGVIDPLGASRSDDTTDKDKESDH